MSDRPLPAWVVERMRLGEIPAAAAERVAAAAADPSTALRLQELATSDEQILRELPPAEVAAEVARRARRVEAERRHLAEARRRRSFIVGGLAAAAAVAAVALALVRAGDVLDRSATNRAPVLAQADTRAKGNPQLLVHLRRGQRVDRLPAGALVRAGDQLQLSYRAGDRSHGVIVSLDGNGTVTLHYPSAVDGSTALRGHGAQRLDHSYELDDAPRFERFVLITAAEPIDVGAVMTAARRLAADPPRAAADPLPLPAALEQWSVFVSKPADEATFPEPDR